jgi:hypothetical protein
MPTQHQVWSVADSLRDKPERVSLRTVRAALPRGGSYRDIGPHLATWKAQRSYQPRIELAVLPEHMQTEMARAAANLWEAAMQQATRLLNAEREQLSAVAAVDRELRDDALATADVLSAQVESLKVEISRLTNELEQSRSQSNGLLEKLMATRPPAPVKPDPSRSEVFWEDVLDRVLEMLLAEPAGSRGLICGQILKRMPADILERAEREGEVVNQEKLMMRLHRSFAQGRRFVREVGHYRPLSRPADQDETPIPTNPE